jgi:uncharacterized protein YegP (UPF0339 family)
MRFEICRSTNNRFYWVIVGANGEVMAQSETMVAKASSESAIRSVKAGAAGAQVVVKGSG